MNSSVQMLYRFMTPIRDRKRIDKKLKKSYVYRILETCLHGVVWLNLVSWVELSASPGQRWEAEGEARGFPSLARGGRNSTQLTKFSDRTPSKHVSNNIHIWILHFNCRVQLSYRFTTPMARPIRGQEMKKSYVYNHSIITWSQCTYSRVMTIACKHDL